MIAYRSEIQTASYLIKQIAMRMGIVFLPILYDLLFPANLIGSSYYTFAVIYAVIIFVDETQEGRIREIRIDMSNKKILFAYYRLFSETKLIILPFDDARLEIAERKSKWYWPWESTVLYFLRNKKELFRIEKSKDGFSIDTLQQISRTVEQLSLPINRINIRFL